MISLDKRSITSKENAKKGGVRTTEGKAISRQNAVKHGIFIRYATALDDFGYEEVYSRFAEEFDDTSPSRAALISYLSVLFIRIRRCFRFESEYLKEHLNPPVHEQRLVRTGIYAFEMDDLDEQYESVLVEAGEPMTLHPNSLSELDNLYTKYEAQFISRFCQIIDILSRSAK